MERVLALIIAAALLAACTTIVENYAQVPGDGPPGSEPVSDGGADGGASVQGPRR